MINRAMTVATLAVLLSVPAAVQSQQCSSGQTGSLGISLIECDCVIAPPTSTTQWRFFTEPKVLRIEPGSPADGVLRVGDVIATINGQTVTAKEGADLLAHVKPGQTVVLAVRRNGQVMTLTLRANALCTTDARVLDVTPAVQRPQSSDAITPGRPMTATTPGGMQAPIGRPGADRATPVLPSRPTVWIGLAFSCGDCTYEMHNNTGRWKFSTPPEVYSVEPQSPAYAAGMRRGDVLTHIDNIPLTNEEGARRWAELKPGDAARIRYRRPERGSQGSTQTTVLHVGAPKSAYSYAQGSRTSSDTRALQALAAQDSNMARALRQMELAVAQQRRDEDVLLRSLQRRLQDTTDEQTSRLLQELLQQQGRQRSQHEQLLSELARMRQTESARSDAARRLLEETFYRDLGVMPVTGVRDLRFSGIFHGNDVEVRGPTTVRVEDLGNELIITTSDATIRVKVRRDP